MGSPFTEQAAPWQFSDADLELVLALGLPIFPVHGVVDDGTGGLRCTCNDRNCAHPGKHPYTATGFKAAVWTARDFRRLCQGQTTLNVGAATGEIVVIDGDVRHGGDVAWWALVRELGIVEVVDTTVQALSGSGGPHVYFGAPAGIVVRSSSNQLARGVDVRASGGYIIVAPSLHIDGGTYVWEASHHPLDTDIAPLPPALLDRILACSNKQNGHGRSGFKSKPRFEGGERNTMLHASGRSMHAKEWSDEAIRAALRAENKAKCRPPLEESEVEEIITNALRQPDRDDFKQSSSNASAFLGFAGIEEVRDKLERLKPGIRLDINKVYHDEYTDAAAALEHFNSAEFAGLVNVLKGIGVSVGRWERGVLDRGRQERARLAEAGNAARVAASRATHAPLASPPPEPWPTPVDGATLLAEIVAAINRFVHIDQFDAWIAAVWCLFTHVFEAVETNPFLRIKAPAPECGKSTLLKALRYLTHRGWLVSRISPSSFARTMNSEHPTLLLDEGDAFLQENEIMRNVLDAASDPDTATISISVPTGNKNWEPVNLDVFVPIAIASIGALRDMQTVESRSISISLKRATRSELKHLEKARRRTLKAALAPLAQKCARWAADNLASLTAAPEPTLPDSWSGRDSDKAEPLVKIADMIGGPWPAQILIALEASFGATDADAPIGVMLLADIRKLFDESGTDRFSSKAMCEALAGYEGRPWAEYGRARKPISQNQLARPIGPFGVRPATIQLADKTTAKGYMRSWFDDAFSRYLPISQDPNRQNVEVPLPVGGNDSFRSVNDDPVDGSKKAGPPHGEKDFDALTLRNSLHGEQHDENEPNGGFEL